MKLTIDLEKKLVKALLKFAGDRDIRYYLNGIAIETGDQGARLIATNGHSLAVAKVEGVFPATPEAIIIPREVLDKLKTTRRDAAFLRLIISGEASPYRVRIEDGVQATECSSMDARFPDWKRVIPRETSGEVAQFNPSLLSAVQSAAILLGSKMGNFSICHNGTSGSLIEFWREDFTAVLMPWRQDTDTNRPPDWINEALNSRFQPRGLGDELEHARYTARLARLAMEADQASAADVESADCMVELAESRMLAQAA